VSSLKVQLFTTDVKFSALNRKQDTRAQKEPRVCCSKSRLLLEKWDTQTFPKPRATRRKWIWKGNQKRFLRKGKGFASVSRKEKGGSDTL